MYRLYLSPLWEFGDSWQLDVGEAIEQAYFLTLLSSIPPFFLGGGSKLCSALGPVPGILLKSDP